MQVPTKACVLLALVTLVLHLLTIKFFYWDPPAPTVHRPHGYHPIVSPLGTPPSRHLPPSATIPKILHFIYVSHDAIPASVQHLWDICAQVNPGWEVKIWTADALPPMMYMHETVEALMAREQLDYLRVSDILRLEAVYHFGGVYLDSDTLCVRPLDGLMRQVSERDCFLAYEDEVERPGLMANGAFGCRARSPMLASMLQGLMRYKGGPLECDEAAWLCTGPKFFQHMVRRWEESPSMHAPNYVILPSRHFFPFHYAQIGSLKLFIECALVTSLQATLALGKELADTYTVQLWGSTTGALQAYDFHQLALNRTVDAAADAACRAASRALVVAFPRRRGLVFVARSGWDEWWQETLPEWEPLTFEVFDGYLSRDVTYVGVGEWIGPTVLYAAPSVARAFAIEPDPPAHAILKASVAANPLLAPRIHVSRLCISDRTEAVLIRGNGGSNSFIDGRVVHERMADFKGEPTSLAHCLPLPAYLEEHGIDPSTAFIKMDTEGAEGWILPSLIPWLESLPHKPTFFISRHRNDLAYRNATVLAAIERFFRLFKYADAATEYPFLLGEGAAFSRDKYAACDYCDFIASDRLPVIEEAAPPVLEDRGARRNAGGLEEEGGYGMGYTEMGAPRGDRTAPDEETDANPLAERKWYGRPEAEDGTEEEEAAERRNRKRGTRLDDDTAREEESERVKRKKEATEEEEQEEQETDRVKRKEEEEETERVTQKQVKKEATEEEETERVVRKERVEVEDRTAPEEETALGAKAERARVKVADRWR